MDLHAQGDSTSSDDSWGGIYDTNRPSLTTALESMGYEVVDLGIVVDEYTSSLLIHSLGLIIFLVGYQRM